MLILLLQIIHWIIFFGIFFGIFFVEYFKLGPLYLLIYLIILISVIIQWYHLGDCFINIIINNLKKEKCKKNKECIEKLKNEYLVPEKYWIYQYIMIYSLIIISCVRLYLYTK